MNALRHAWSALKIVPPAVAGVVFFASHSFARTNEADHFTVSQDSQLGSFCAVDGAAHYRLSLLLGNYELTDSPEAFEILFDCVTQSYPAARRDPVGFEFFYAYLSMIEANPKAFVSLSSKHYDLVREWLVDAPDYRSGCIVEERNALRKQRDDILTRLFRLKVADRGPADQFNFLYSQISKIDCSLAL